MAIPDYLWFVFVVVGLILTGILAGYRLHDIQRKRALRKMLRGEEWSIKLNWVADTEPDPMTVQKAADKLYEIEQAARNARWN